MMQRRLFLQALAASVVAAGGALPVGFPENLKPWFGTNCGFEWGATDMYFWPVWGCERIVLKGPDFEPSERGKTLVWRDHFWWEVLK